MKTKTKLLFMLMLICFGLPGATDATIYFDDGQVHTIDYVIDEEVIVRNNFWGEPTTINFTWGAELSGSLQALDDSVVNISGRGHFASLRFRGNSRGNITSESRTVYPSILDFGATDTSQVTISGGYFPSFFNTSLSSQIYILGDAMIGGRMSIVQDSYVDVCGGMLSGLSGGELGWLYLWGGSMSSSASLVLHGNFTIDGRPAFGTFTATGGDMLHGHLAGTLADGTSFGSIRNFDFTIEDYASLVLVPEPATVLLLGLGSFIFLRKC